MWRGRGRERELGLVSKIKKRNCLIKKKGKKMEPQFSNLHLDIASVIFNI